jgi:endonuclease YncB( thermonuclease family)
MRRSITTAAMTAAGVAFMAPAAEGGTTRAKVVRVMDGDTFRIAAGGASRTVRLLGVGAPARGDCFAAEATTALRRLLPSGAAVRLTTDGRRRGVYVRRNGRLVNQAMLAGGFATGERLRGLRRRADLSAAARRAEAAGRGLWRACAPSPAPPVPTTGAPGPAPVTGPAAPAPAAASAQLTAELAGRVLRYFESSGNCQFGCFVTELSLEFCTDGRFAFASSFATSGNGDRRRDEGTWRVPDAALAPDGTLGGTVELTLLRGTTIDRGEGTVGSVTTRTLSLARSGEFLVGGERWFREPSGNCA